MPKSPEGFRWNVEEIITADLSQGDLAGIRHLMTAAFGDRFSDADWNHALGGKHFVVRDSMGTIISHAAVVSRTLEVSGDELTTGYVEAVATQPEFQGKGLATAVMRAVAKFIDEGFQIGALSGIPDFYEKLGWEKWRGRTWCRDGRDLSRTPEEDDDVYLLQTRASPPIEMDGDIAVEWREGDVW